jgi:hypothetical protein
MFKSVIIAIVAFIHHVSGATITVDSFQIGNEGAKAIDTNTSTFWHSQYSPTLAQLPHTAVIDLGSSQLLNGFSYLPRQDGSSNGNIGQHTIELSVDSTTWHLVANASFIDDESPKQTGFANTQARYIRIIALTEAGNRGPWSSAAEFGVNIAPTSTTNGQCKCELVKARLSLQEIIWESRYMPPPETCPTFTHSSFLKKYY